VCAECPARLARDLEAGFPDLVAHHQDLVYGMALRMTGRPADAEDLAQEAFLRAYRALRRYAPERTAGLLTRGWLAAIVANLGRDRARRRRPPPAALDGLADQVTDASPRPDELVTRREAAGAWAARLAALPEAQRRAVELRHIEGLTYPELALALGRPLGTVKSDVHRGVRALREAWVREERAGASRRLSEVNA
jgi:RNA polymerase sigma-70 factor (ECF subfamily)